MTFIINNPSCWINGSSTRLCGNKDADVRRRLRDSEQVQSERETNPNHGGSGGIPTGSHARAWILFFNELAILGRARPTAAADAHVGGTDPFPVPWTGQVERVTQAAWFSFCHYLVSFCCSLILHQHPSAFR